MSENNIEGDQPERCKEAKFVDDNSAELIQRVTSVLPIADELKQEEGMLHQEKYDEIKAEKTNQDKMRKLFESLNSGGNKVKIAFYYLVEKHHLHLFKDLGGVSRKRKLSYPESPVPYKRLNNESYEPNNPHASTLALRPAIHFVTNIVNERRPYENINNISILKKMEWKLPAPMKEKKPPAPKKERKPSAHTKEKKPPVPKKERKPSAHTKEKKPPVPKKERKPSAHTKEKKPPVPKKEKKPPAPKKEKKLPAPMKEKKPPAPKKVKKTPAPKKVKKTPAPKKVKKTPAPKKVKKAAA